MLKKKEIIEKEIIASQQQKIDNSKLNDSLNNEIEDKKEKSIIEEKKNF